jgi:hypothetical protein
MVKYNCYYDYRGKAAVVVSVITHATRQFVVTENPNAAYRVDIHHVYRNDFTGVMIARMEEVINLKKLGTFLMSVGGQEAVLVQFPDKSKLFLKGENVFEKTFDQYFHP